jgi:hypothetical protein
MADSLHAPEPWKLILGTLGISDEKYLKAVVDSAGKEVRVKGMTLSSGPEPGANARRIVACVNACATISTQDLESGYLSRVREDRDRLREALSNAETRIVQQRRDGCTDEELAQTVDEVRAALAATAKKEET